MRSDELQAFLSDAATQAGISREEVLQRVLHLRVRDIEGFMQEMQPEAKALFCELDYGLRIRNPGLHYAPRKSYLGYRREDLDAAGAGKRSQVFVSILRNNTSLDIVLPLDPISLSHIPGVRDLTGIGHHGVGSARVLIGDTVQLKEFFSNFDYWLRPRISV